MKRLIVNADDFGLTRGVNRAIAEAHQHGVVTSATVMAAGAELADALALAKQLRQLSVGCHIDLIQLAPVLPTSHLQTLTNGATFRPGFLTFATAALGNRLSSTQITAEAEAQMAKLQSAGIELSHFDTHKHTHMFPQVLRPLLKAAKTRGVRAVRNPFEPDPLLRFSDLALQPALVMRYGAVRAFRSMSGKFRRIVNEEGFVTTDGTVGITLTGFLDEGKLHGLIGRIPEGTWELVTHPGYCDGVLGPLSSLTKSRETELALLTSERTRSLLQELGVQLISYRDLIRL